jgi:hypothetical protein
MPKSLRSAGLVAVMALVAAAPAVAQPKPVPTDNSGLPEKFSGEEIKRTWFDGRPFVATGPDGTAYRMVFTDDGKAARLPENAGKKAHPTIGYWRVIAEGYCSRWTGSNREKCFNVRKSQVGDGTVVRFGQQIVANWKRP